MCVVSQKQNPSGLASVWLVKRFLFMIKVKMHFFLFVSKIITSVSPNIINYC